MDAAGLAVAAVVGFSDKDLLVVTVVILRFE